MTKIINNLIRKSDVVLSAASADVSINLSNLNPPLSQYSNFIDFEAPIASNSIIITGIILPQSQAPIQLRIYESVDARNNDSRPYEDSEILRGSLVSGLLAQIELSDGGSSNFSINYTSVSTIDNKIYGRVFGLSSIAQTSVSFTIKYLRLLEVKEDIVELEGIIDGASNYELNANKTYLIRTLSPAVLNLPSSPTNKDFVNLRVCGETAINTILQVDSQSSTTTTIRDYGSLTYLNAIYDTYTFHYFEALDAWL